MPDAILQIHGLKSGKSPKRDFRANADCRQIKPPRSVHRQTLRGEIRPYSYRFPTCKVRSADHSEENGTTTIISYRPGIIAQGYFGTV